MFAWLVQGKIFLVCYFVLHSCILCFKIFYQRHQPMLPRHKEVILAWQRDQVQDNRQLYLPPKRMRLKCEIFYQTQKWWKCFKIIKYRDYQPWWKPTQRQHNCELCYTNWLIVYGSVRSFKWNRSHGGEQKCRDADSFAQENKLPFLVLLKRIS